MSSEQSKASATPSATAPDGIAIHAFNLRGGTFTGIAEGRIPKGRFAIHRHLTIEQYTYILSGTLTALVGNLEGVGSRSLTLGVGDLLFNGPGESLEFVNTTDEAARVLFICSPPYPPDDSDTRVLDAHAPPAATELEAARLRLLALRQQLNHEIDRRLASLEAGIVG
jgi:mannose-6-phosphate isomerase-like protein (cupin superfamily)